jgi:hypothetical protein
LINSDLNFLSIIFLLQLDKNIKDSDEKIEEVHKEEQCVKNDILFTKLSFFYNELCVVYDVEAGDEEAEHQVGHVVEGISKKPSKEVIKEEDLNEA